MIRNTYVGIKEVDSQIIESAIGMGTTEKQLLIRIQLPQALPVIMSGFRTMVIMTIALAGIASFIGAVDEIARTALQDELLKLHKMLHKTILFKPQSRFVTEFIGIKGLKSILDNDVLEQVYSNIVDHEGDMESLYARLLA